MLAPLEQLLNGLQFGVMLFLMAAGLTLVFGIMNVINLAHGAFYMLGAYVAASVAGAAGSFVLAVLAAVAAVALVGVVVEVLAVGRLYARDHLQQVLATFGLIFVFDEAVRWAWGPQALFIAPPATLAGHVEIVPGAPYPAYRLAILGVGLAVALALYLLIARTRIGMLIRAGAANREMVSALGVDIGRLFTLVFALGAGLAALGGAMAAPILAVQSGMGGQILILTFVVIVIGGIGSVRGAFVAALAVGLADTFGRVALPPALAEMVIYLMMAAVLFWRPRGLFPAHG